MGIPQSAIIHQNSTRTVFLVDIPTSIAIAQDLARPVRDKREHGSATGGHKAKKQIHHRRHLLSTPPLNKSYPSPPEPKTDAARRRVLERIPAEERALHDDIFGPLVKDALRELKENNGWGPWCFPRCLVEENEERGRTAKRRHLDVPYISSSSVSQAQIYGSKCAIEKELPSPPLILSPSDNDFESWSELQNILVKNTSPTPARLRIQGSSESGHADQTQDQRSGGVTFTVPPESAFLLCTLSMEAESGLSYSNPIPGIPTNQKFNLILLDPPWPNRSVRRSSHYMTHPYSDMDNLTTHIGEILRNYLYDPCIPLPTKQKSQEDNAGNATARCEKSIAAIWVTNTVKSRKAAYDSMLAAGLTVIEEWIWVKTTIDGEPVTPIDGLWRKPYEVLIIGQKFPENYCESNNGKGRIKLRRVIAAVPDIHSRKPNLRELFETIFFSATPGQSDDKHGKKGQEDLGKCLRYSALEVFARNLTAGWWACGNEVLKFNNKEWWTKE